MTEYGREISEIIKSSGAHPTAEQSCRVLKAREPRVVPATVYNDLRIGCICPKCRQRAPDDNMKQEVSG